VLTRIRPSRSGGSTYTHLGLAVEPLVAVRDPGRLRVFQPALRAGRAGISMAMPRTASRRHQFRNDRYVLRARALHLNILGYLFGARRWQSSASGGRKFTRRERCLVSSAHQARLVPSIARSWLPGCSASRAA
jgi:hypothetical protein